MPRPKTGNWVGSMVEAAAAIGCDKQALQVAKAAGCAGFKGSRVNIDEVRKWLADNAQQIDAAASTGDKRSLECQKLQRQIRALDFEHEKARGEYWPAADVRRYWLQHCGQVRMILVGMPAELAPSLAGLTVAEIERRLSGEVDRMLEALQSSPLGGKPLSA